MKDTTYTQAFMIHLIQRHCLLFAQPGDDNHELALDFCLHTTQFHRYADTNPKAVDEHYERFAAHLLA